MLEATLLSVDFEPTAGCGSEDPLAICELFAPLEVLTRITGTELAEEDMELTVEACLVAVGGVVLAVETCLFGALTAEGCVGVVERAVIDGCLRAV